MVHSLTWRRVLRIALAMFLGIGLVGSLCLWAVTDDSGADHDMTYRSLDYDATVRPNGDLRVVEHVDMKLGNRSGLFGSDHPWRQLFQRFEINDTDDGENPLSAITDVSVRDADTGKVFRHGDARSAMTVQSDEAMEHTDWNRQYAGTWYAMMVDGGYENYAPAARRDVRTWSPESQGSGDASGQADSNTTSGNAAAGKSATDGSAADNADTNKTDAGKSDSKTTDDGNSSSNSTDNKDSADSQSEGKNDHGTLEIGWNIPETKSAKSVRFDISMTLKDVVKVYDDVAYVKWEPIAGNNTVPVKRMGMRITLPKGAAKGQTWQWLHFEGRGSIAKGGARVVEASARNVKHGEHVDAVLMFPRSAMGKVRHDIYGSQKQKVLSNERLEQDSASWDRSESVVLLAVFLLLVAMFTAIGIGLVVSSNKAVDYKGAGGPNDGPNNKRKVGRKDEVDYYRDLPDVSPAVAAKLLSVLDPGDYGTTDEGRDLDSRKYKSRVMATVLFSLVRKKLVAVYPGRSAWYRGVDFSTAGDAQLRERYEAGLQAAKAGNDDIYDEKYYLPNLLAPYPASRHGKAGSASSARGSVMGSSVVRKLVRRLLPYRPTSTIVMLTDPDNDPVFRRKGKKGGKKRQATDLQETMEGRSFDVGYGRRQGDTGAQTPEVAAIASLSDAEARLLLLLRHFADLSKEGDRFDLVQMRHCAKKSPEAAKMRGKFIKAVQKEFGKEHLVSSRPVTDGSPGSVYMLAALVVEGLFLALVWHLGLRALTVELGMLGLFCLCVTGTLIRSTTLTKGGATIAGQVLGLRRYLLDFSDFSDRDVPDLALWDQYLVYATALGASKPMTKRMAGVVPQLEGDDADGRFDDSLWMWSAWGLGSGGADLTDAFGDIGSGLSSGFDGVGAIISSSSSGSGGGGGSFGGSGGGSGGGSFGGR
ncbi:DUF2207 domain-containing protein [Bifidobacterium sp. ESL0763]|uniref:DUF2207 family protein n=1 Tax=Bifidobacterium sp. ESL0763 TaxID=2983227 RepID=UPI0023F6F226|nr:DUF2207 domain-containing protein [Bifidobacterium sp. ESL0763]MDF7663375.1 DUF2207 domain-containing protein [Bifidobacterium sp. ESL0763]